MNIIIKGLNIYSLFHATLFTLCSGFVLTSSAASSNSNLKFFAPGERIVYNWQSTVLLNENEEGAKNFGFSLVGQVIVSSVWESEEKRILVLQLVNPKLQVKPKAGFPSEEHFVPQASKLDSYENKQFSVVLNKGDIEKIFIANSEQVSLKNIKKGIASLFQLQSTEEENSETDSSGQCNVSYNYSTSNIRKVKSSCIYDDANNLIHGDPILGTNIVSTRETEYIRDSSGMLLNSVVSKETHKVSVHAKQELGCTIFSEQVLTYEKSEYCDKIAASSLEAAIKELTSKKGLDGETMLTGIEASTTEHGRKQFSKDVESLRESLKTKYLGTITSAKAFLKLFDGARTSNIEEISKALKSKKNKEILYQLYDILGYTQTPNSHKAVMKHLHLDSEEHADFIERYLWSLSFSIHPNIEILEDLLNKYRKYTKIPDRVRDTLILSLASMARTISRSPRHDYDTLKVLRNVEESITNGFDYAKDDGRYVFLNALKNLQSPSTVPKLMTILQNGTSKEEVLVWRVLKSFGIPYWTDDLLKRAEKTIYQLDKKHDPSSRAIAVDILLASGPSDLTLENLLNFVASNDTNYEIRQYVFQSIIMMSSKCKMLNQRVKNIIKNSKTLNNYSSLSPRGLSTALTRSMFSGSSLNGSLVSIQEIKGGIVKRGVVDVLLEKDGLSKELFTLGIFAGGLSSFVSSNSDEEEDETSTAGMELTVMGTQIRPFVFFEGQGELMGHVWSGTASEMTPAFQALILTQDHQEYLRLANGFIVEMNLKGAISFDLSGKIEISIWNRNAQSLIEKSVGYVSSGFVKIDTPFVKSKVEFEGTIEPKLSLQIDADFSNSVKLCMRLSQPDSVFRHGFTKLETVPGSQYHLKSAVKRKKAFPGTTFALNRKNDEMCSVIFS